MNQPAAEQPAEEIVSKLLKNPAVKTDPDLVGRLEAYQAKLESGEGEIVEPDLLEQVPKKGFMGTEPLSWPDDGMARQLVYSPKKQELMVGEVRYEDPVGVIIKSEGDDFRVKIDNRQIGTEVEIKTIDTERRRLEADGESLPSGSWIVVTLKDEKGNKAEEMLFLEKIKKEEVEEGEGSDEIRLTRASEVPLWKMMVGNPDLISSLKDKGEGELFTEPEANLGLSGVAGHNIDNVVNHPDMQAGDHVAISDWGEELSLELGHLEQSDIRVNGEAVEEFGSRQLVKGDALTVGRVPLVLIYEGKTEEGRRVFTIKDVGANLKEKRQWKGLSISEGTSRLWSEWFKGLIQDKSFRRNVLTGTTLFIWDLSENEALPLQINLAFRGLNFFNKWRKLERLIRKREKSGLSVEDIAVIYQLTGQSRWPSGEDGRQITVKNIRALALFNHLPLLSEFQKLSLESGGDVIDALLDTTLGVVIGLGTLAGSSQLLGAVVGAERSWPEAMLASFLFRELSALGPKTTSFGITYFRYLAAKRKKGRELTDEEFGKIYARGRWMDEVASVTMGAATLISMGLSMKERIEARAAEKVETEVKEPPATETSIPPESPTASPTAPPPASPTIPSIVPPTATQSVPLPTVTAPVIPGATSSVLEAIGIVDNPLTPGVNEAQVALEAIQGGTAVDFGINEVVRQFLIDSVRIEQGIRDGWVKVFGETIGTQYKKEWAEIDVDQDGLPDFLRLITPNKGGVSLYQRVGVDDSGEVWYQEMDGTGFIGQPQTFTQITGIKK